MSFMTIMWSWSFPPQNMGPGLATATLSGMAETVERLWSGMDVKAAAVVGRWGHLQKGAGGVWRLAAACEKAKNL